MKCLKSKYINYKRAKNYKNYKNNNKCNFYKTFKNYRSENCLNTQKCDIYINQKSNYIHVKKTILYYILNKKSQIH